MAPVDLTHIPRIEFWLGRAGSGKTSAALATIAAEVNERPRGVPLLIIVPEQATAQVERRLAALADQRAGFTRARVFSFTHLLREALAHVGGAPARLLSPAGRVMLLRRALGEVRGELKIFGTGADAPGFADCLSEALTEFERYGWSPELIGDWLAGPFAEERAQTTLTRKLHDFALLWGRYNALLAEAGLNDPAAWHAAGRCAVTEWSDLAGALVWIDGFYSFTAQEAELIEALGRQAEQITLCFTLDPGVPAIAVAENAPDQTVRQTAKQTLRPRVAAELLFENVERAYLQLRDRYGELGWGLRTLNFPLPDTETRFAQAPALAHIESRILGRLRPVRFNGADLRATEWPAEPVEFLEADDRRAEVEAIARRIVHLCRTDSPRDVPRLRWREVGLLARDLEPYAGLVRDVFGQFEIPYFLDRAEEVQGHPLSRLLVSALAVLRSNSAGGAARAHLKTGLAGLRDPDAIAALENLILATDPEGNTWREPAPGSGSSARAAVQALARWHEAEAPLHRLGKRLRADASPARALWSYLEEIEAARTLEAWIELERAAGREAQAQIHEQAWKEATVWLADLDQLYPAPEKPVRKSDRELFALFEELSDLIESALAATRARLIPPTLDQVTVGAVDRSRLPECAAVFVMGMNLGELPRFYTSDPLLGDDERRQLTEPVQIVRSGGGDSATAGRMQRTTPQRIGPTSRQKRHHEQFLAYMALTRATEYLILSRPLKCDDGKASEPSPLFTLLAENLPDAPRRNAGRGGLTSAGGAAPEHLALPVRAEEWALRLNLALSDLNSAARLREAAALLRAGDPAAEANAGLAARTRDHILAGRRSLLPETPMRIDPALARACWDDAHPLAITALERLAACPFKFFAQDMLRLRERDSAELSDMDLGRLRHELLEHLFKLQGDAQGVAWGELDLGAADAEIERWLTTRADDRHWAAHFRRESLARTALEGAARDLKFFIRAVRLMGARSQLRQVAAEWQFGGDAPFIIETEGLPLRLHGTVDRVDAIALGGSGAADAGIAGNAPLILIDFKSGVRRIDLARLAHGLELQLPLYAAALQNQFRPGAAARVAGFFYWPLQLPLRDAEDADENVAGGTDAESEAVAAWLAARKLTGWFAAEYFGALDRDVAPGEGAIAFNFRRNKDGKLSEVGKAHWSAEHLGRFILRQQQLAAELWERAAEGRLAPAPYQLRNATACDFCELTALCRRRDPRGCPPNVLAEITREALLEELS